MKALLFGATGSVGQEVLKELQNEKLAIHAVRRQSTPISGAGVQWFTHDVQEGPGREELWKGVTHVFLMSPPGYTRQDKILIPIIEKARSQGVQKLVLMTAFGANHAVGSPTQQSEVALQTSGLNSAIIRPNWFMQNFHTYWGQALRTEQKVLVPAGSAKTSFIDARDIGAVAAALLRSPLQGEFDLTGSEALTHAEVAGILAEVTARKITYIDAEPKAFEQNLGKAGLNPEYAAFLMIILGALRDGHAAAVTNNVEKILQRKPRRFSDYAQDYRESLL